MPPVRPRLDRTQARVR